MSATLEIHLDPETFKQLEQAGFLSTHNLQERALEPRSWTKVAHYRPVVSRRGCQVRRHGDV